MGGRVAAPPHGAESLYQEGRRSRATAPCPAGGGAAARRDQAKPAAPEVLRRGAGLARSRHATAPKHRDHRRGGVKRVKAHVDSHLAGTLQGEIPAAWLAQQGRVRCLICGLSVSERHGIHPTCRPEARQAFGAGVARPAAGGALPSFDSIQAGTVRTL